jgi:hypothetical protein
MADADITSNPVEETDLSSPTFEEAFNKASGTLPSSTEKEEESPQPAEEAPKEEPEPEEKPETPLNQFDPDKLPPELQQVYKNLMKGFTQGRQKDREELNQLREELKSLKAQAPEEEPKNLTPEEYIDKLVKDKVNEQKLEAFRDTALQEYDSLDPRLSKPTDAKENDQYDRLMDKAIGAELDELLQEHINVNGSELGFDYKSHGKRLVAEWDQYLQRTRDAFLSKQREIAKKQERSFQKANPKSSQTPTKPSGSMSLEQAVNAAWSKHSA